MGAVAGLLPPSVEAQVADRRTYVYAALDELEYRAGGGDRPVEFTGQAWIGGDYDRLWIMGEGGRSTTGGGGDVEGEVLYGRLVAPFFDAQVGLRVDAQSSGGDGVGVDTRSHLALGLHGLAPYWFQVGAFLYLSQEGDLSGRLRARYDLFVTQRLIAEPEVEANVALQEVPAFGTGSGLNDLELGVRMRYELVREIAPYLGLSWVRRFGSAADFARADDGAVNRTSFVAGVRAWW